MTTKTASDIVKNMTGADAIIDVLAQYGIDFLFTSPIAALAPLWEGFAKREQDGLGPHPRYMQCRHEVLAVGLAIGHYKSTGKMAAVCLPTGLGVQNASMALRMARQEKVPMLIMSPDTLTFGEDPKNDPGPEWATLLIDEYGPARNAETVTKWSIACRTDGDLYPNLHRAIFFASQIPRGPCLVEVPFDILMSPFGDMINRFPAITSDKVQASDEHIRQIASIISRAKNPIIITEHFGSNDQAVATLKQFAERIAAPVFEWWMPSYMNFDRAHPLHGGGYVEAILSEGDTVIVACANGPWHGPLQTLKDGANVIVIDEDPLRPASAYWGYETTHVVSGDPVANLQRICENVRVDADEVSTRHTRWSEYNAEKKEAFHARSVEESSKSLGEGKIPAKDFFEHLSTVLPADAIIVDEIVSEVPYYTHYLFKDRTKSFQHIRGWHGGLGTGLSVALGCKIANPEKTVVCIIGDGALSYNPIPSVLGFSQQHRAPIIICIMNNSGYACQKWNMYKYFDKGIALQTNNTYGDVIGPDPKYDKLADPWGGMGMLVATKDDLEEALSKAVKNSSTFSLLNVNVDP